MKHSGAPYVDIDETGTPHTQPEFPVGDGLLRYMRCSRSGRKLAGTTGDDRVYEWDGAQWIDHGHCFGPRPVIYRGEELLIWRQQSSNPPEAKGYRYVDAEGRAVHASPDTVSDRARRVWEFTVLGNGMIVGQGGKGAHGEDPCIIVDRNGVRRLVKAGMCRFIVAYQAGPKLHIGWVEPGGCDSISMFEWEVGGLEVAAEPDPDGAPSPQPPIPLPPKGNKMRIPDDVHRIYVQVYAKFPDLFRSRSDEERREGNRRAIATIRAKRVPNWERWVWKTAHSNGSSPSKDAIGFVPDAPVHEILHRARVRLLLWDMINGNSREVNPPGENQHDVDDQYVVLDGVEPFDYLEDGTQPAPRPQPDPGGTHRYMGGSTDTGTCDECGRSREEGVHRVPEGRTQHKPWQGEDGRGPCDLCFQPIEADIHRSVPVDAQPPNPVLTHSPSPPVLQPHVFQGVTRCDVPKCGRAKSDGIHIKEPADLDPQPDDDARMVRIEQALQRIEAILGRVFRA